MVWDFDQFKYVNSFSAGAVFIRQYLTFTVVYRRQIMTYKDGSRTEGVKVLNQKNSLCKVNVVHAWTPPN